VNAFILSDLHAHSNWPFSRILPTGRPSRFQDLLNVLTQVERELETRQVEDLLILGDLTHRRHFINFSLYNPLWDALHRLAERVKQTVILAGNHDYEDTETHSLHVLRGLPNTLVVDRPAVVSLANGHQSIFALPWLQDPRAIADAVDKAPALPLFGHYGAEGCPLETDYWLDSPIKLGELARFPLTVFGHIHKPSAQLDGRVQYVGAPMHFDFGDHGPRGGLHLVEKTFKAVPLHAPQMVTAKWPRVPLPPEDGGYLRVVDVPGEALVEAQEEATRLGWLGCLPLERSLPEVVREAVLAGLVVNEQLLIDYVARALPDLDPAEQQAVVAEGLAILEATRT
jgi:DNA repair exonuclease SbcCD nuclease subunit